MVRELRKGMRNNGLILANGGVLTYQHAICLSKQPRRDEFEYPGSNPLPRYVADVPVPIAETQVEGEAYIEASSSRFFRFWSSESSTDVLPQTYTVSFDRNGHPSQGFVIGRLKSNDHRFIANTSDGRALEQLGSGSKEPIGRAGWVKPDGNGRNLFSFEQASKL